MQGVMIQPAFSQAERKVHIKHISALTFPEAPGVRQGQVEHAVLPPAMDSAQDTLLLGGVQVTTSTHQHLPAFQGSPASYTIPVSFTGKTCTHSTAGGSYSTGHCTYSC